MRPARSSVVWILFLVSLPAFCLANSGNLPALSVQESKMQFVMEPQPRLELPLVNRAGKTLGGRVHLEILGEDGKVRASTDADLSIAPGSQTQVLPWAKESLPSDSPSYLYWHRLRYRITPDAAGGFAAQEGIVQLSRLIPSLFRIMVSGNKRPHRGSNLLLRVRVDDPSTGKGLSGVRLEAKLKVDDKSPSLPSRAAKTDSQGYAILGVKIPADIKENDPSVEVTAWHGPWHDSESVELDLRDRLNLTLSTDKPIYQPGQVLHMRTLVLGPDNHAVTGGKLTFIVEDDDSNVEFQQAVNTSGFGVAQAEWEIPEKVKMGPYTIKAQFEDDDSDNSTRSKVRISRYELPQFTVHPETDRPYYLPGQNPKVEVTANYLFGKPVTRGKVRIVRTEERHWDSKTQKWESDEEDIHQGELDASGKFTASLDLSTDFASLRGKDYSRLEDLRFAAYVTDLSTNRTEQKRFAVRITKDSIHVYAIGGAVPGMPLDFYVTTAYADGTPASADVVVSAVRPAKDGGFPNGPMSGDHLRLAHIHTNRYGVGHLRAPALPTDLLYAPQSGYLELMLLLEAADSRGKKGAHSEALWMPAGPYMRIKPVKSLLREGENVLAEIESSLPDERFFVDLMGTDGALQSQQVVLRHGHAQVEFSYDPAFRNSLMLVAYNMNTGGKQMELAAGAGVLFPEPQELDLGLHLQKATYKPGDPALAQFRVRAPDGRPARSALGIVVYDKAVAERVRNDEEFGSYGFYYSDYKWNSYSSIAGISYQDLLSKKLTAPVSPDLELLAEAILATGSWWDSTRFLESSGEYRRDPSRVFQLEIGASLAQPEKILKSHYGGTFEFPRNQEQLQKFLLQGGINFADLRDPWGMPYRARFLVEGADEVVQFISDGPDKLSETTDDFVAYRVGLPYFTPTGGAINWASQNYFQRTGQYIRDYPTLKKELQAKGIDLDMLKDPWGHSYDFKFEIEQANYVIRITSAGPDGVFNSKESPSQDDVDEWKSTTGYFQRERAAISKALAEYMKKTGSFPTNENEFRPVLEAAGLSAESLVDPWGYPYHLEFSQSNRYWDKVIVNSYSVNGEPQKTTKVTPVTQRLGWITVMSYGPKRDLSYGGFNVASFSEVLSEQSSKDPIAPKTSDGPTPLMGDTGAISGTVTDPSGAVIAGALIKATNLYLGTVYTTMSDESGEYLLSNIATGTYHVEINHVGFTAAIMSSIPVTSSNVTTVDVRLNVGSTTETVEVTAAAPLVESTSSMVSQSSSVRGSGTVHAEQQAFTPRLRKYFPETLVWQPELVTDSSGRAQFKFLMADNITTWKMSVIGSTMNGQLGMAETELRTFQPFFVDHDPPKILTQGDQIQLPVVLRNYMDKPQEVNVKLDPAPWFSVSGASEQQIKVLANQDAVAPFLISADKSVHDGKQRVSAANHQTGDAVERTVSVHPDGEDVTQTVAAVLSGNRSSLEVEVPANAVLGSIEAELKIYPSLGAHVLDAVHGMVLRPAGCGEQITSLAFGSLLALQVLKKAGQDDPQKPGNPNAELAARARKYLKQGYDQLAALQADNGGFPYWANHETDISLTAYVLDFLQQASEFVTVDPALLAHARKYLVTTQSPGGNWLFYFHGGQPRPDTNVTALTVRVLAAGMKGEDGRKEVGAAVDKAMKYLEDRISEWNDPYLVGQYALAAVASDYPGHIAKAKARLLELAHQEGSGTYWNLEANTSPFYGWGTAGRIETTALAVQALFILRQKNHDDAELSRYADRGLIFLLHSKDRYGVWYSTQATVNVLKAIIGAVPQVSAGPHPAETAEVVVNGQHLSSLRLPASGELSGALLTNISSALRPGVNRVEIVRQNEGGLLQAQIVATHYIRWSDSQATKSTAFKVGESRALRLGVAFDTTETKIGEPVRCTVEAERVGFSGYGMMLAEIGLPPGADVDRGSLEQAMSDYGVSQYDVLPDRVVFYLWPRAGGSKFSFVFRPRLGMKAAAAPSTVYDYYNPESHAVVAPARFNVH
jgi:hypothetical protein